MNLKFSPRLRGISFALGSALLFGASTPFAKILLNDSSPVLLAGLLYLGAGIGLTLFRFFQKKSVARESRLTRKELPWFFGSVLVGGIAAPLFLLFGLQRALASHTALLLNLEAVATACIAWFIFHENVNRRVAVGFILIAVGGLVLSWPAQGSWGFSWGAGLILLACLGWGIDNNLTRKISTCDPVQIAAIKGLIAGSINTAIAFAQGAVFPAPKILMAAGLIGFISYGVSMVFFVLALRNLGTARTGAYFSIAPFVGGFLSLLLLHDTPSTALLISGLLMAVGVWLHLTEHHEHEHFHEPMAHEHPHVHDEHHQHAHTSEDPHGEPHTHWHRHEPLRHSHRHDPDIHHQHRH